MRFAFDRCDAWGIDDPIAWLNMIPPKVLDWWIAYYSLINDEKSQTGVTQSPEALYRRLHRG